MSYRLELKCSPTFEKLIENGIKIEEALVKRGVIKIYSEKKSSNSSNNYNNDKPNFWQQNKNVGNNDGTIENQNAKPVFNLIATATKTNQNNNPPKNQKNNQNVNQNNNQGNVESRTTSYRTTSN